MEATFIPTDTELLNIYINQIRQHSNVSKSLKSLKLLITNLMNGSDINNKKWLKKFVKDDLLQLIINDMIFYKKNTIKYNFKKLQQHILFLHFLFDLSELSPIPFNIKPKQLFEQFIINNSNNDFQRFVVLELFISIWRSNINYQQMVDFYNSYFKQLMIKYSNDNNYSMIICLYYCFSIYFIKIENNDSNNNDSTLCLKYLKVDKIKITKFLMNELRETIKLDNKSDNKFKLHHLLHSLKDIFISSEKPLRISFINNDNKNTINYKVKETLNEIFKAFATTNDGSMCHDDMRRYIVSTGKNINNASKTRIRHIFNDREKLSFNGFFNYYKSAILQKPDSVWNDIMRFGYKYDLESQFIDNDNNNNKIRDLIAKDKDYGDILFRYFENHEHDNDNNWETFEMIHTLPLVHKYQKQLYSLQFNKLFDNNLYKMIYWVLSLNSIIIAMDKLNDDKFRISFIKNRKINALCAALLGFYARGKNDYKYYKDHEGYQLGRSLLFKIMYWFESKYMMQNVKMYQFINQKLQKFNCIDLFSDDEILSLINSPKNNLIHMICMIAKKTHNKNVCPIKAGKLVDLMPTKVLRMYGQPLITGFIKKYYNNKKIPNDIIHLVLHFFAGGCCT